ncbi:hypothetical protein CSB20_08060, partial [bacterium DOLZORAL124_64_63]
MSLDKVMEGWCREAAEIARGLHRRTGALEFKHGQEAVTEADRRIEQLLRRRIGAAFPDDLIVGEEYGGPEEGNMPGRRVWQIDPIDGTLNYALGLPAYCTSLALVQDGQVLAACIHQPPTGDTFTALRGAGSFLNGERRRLRPCASLREAVFSFQLKSGGAVMAEAERQHRLCLSVMKVRRAGAVALELAWVGGGLYDGLLGSFAGRVPAWDVAAGLLLSLEAGAVATDFQGRPY